MEELIELKSLIEAKDYEKAIALINDMEEMAKDDKINKIESFIEILLIHLIKQKAEKRTSSSWDKSIRNSLRGIYKSNKRRNAKGFYISKQELQNAIQNSFNYSLKDAADEAFGGAFNAKQLRDMIDEDEVINEALFLILNYNNEE